MALDIKLSTWVLSQIILRVFLNISSEQRWDWYFYTEFPQGYVGEQFKSRNDRPFNSELFSQTELEVLERVSNTFKPTTTTDIVKLSHLEDAWKKKRKKDKSIISYQYAFELKQI